MYIENFDMKIFDKLPSDAIMIRELVFVEEQGFQNEFDEIDEDNKTMHIRMRKNIVEG